jgi:hypothetical protein
MSVIVSYLTLTKTSVAWFDIDRQFLVSATSLDKAHPGLTLWTSQDIPRSNEHGDVVRAPIIALDRNFDLGPFLSRGREEPEAQFLTDTLNSISRAGNRFSRGVRHIPVFNIVSC